MGDQCCGGGKQEESCGTEKHEMKGEHKHGSCETTNKDTNKEQKSDSCCGH